MISRVTRKARKQYRKRIPPWARSAFPECDKNGEVRQRFEDPGAAAIWKAGIEQELLRLRIGAERASVGAAPARRMTFLGASGPWLDRENIKPSTRSTYLDRLNAGLYPAFGKLDLTSITRAAIERYLDERRKAGIGPGARRQELIVLRGVLKHAKRRGYAIAPDALDVETPKAKPKTQRRYDPAVYERFLSFATPEERLDLEIAAATGMRAGELRHAKVEWIDWRGQKIVVPAVDGDWTSKSGKPRSIPIFDRLEMLLRQRVQGRESGLLLAPRRGKVHSHVYFQRIFQRIRQESGIFFRGVHDLRHHYLSWLFERGVNAVDVQAIAGHANLATTQQYAHSRPDFLDHARQRLRSGSRSNGRRHGKWILRKRDQSIVSVLRLVKTDIKQSTANDGDKDEE